MANIFHIERTDNKITLGATGTTIYIRSHTASKILALDASKNLESITVGTGLDYTRPNLTLSHLGIEALVDEDTDDKIIFWDDSAGACKWLRCKAGGAVWISATPELYFAWMGIENLDEGGVDKDILYFDGPSGEFKFTNSPTLAGLTISGLVVEADGTIKLNGAATVWNDANMGVAQLALPVAAQPDEDEFVDEGGSDTGISTWAFAIGEKVSGSIEIPHDYKEGSNITFHIHWQGIAAPTGTDNVKWQCTYTVGKVDATLDAVATTVIETAFDTQYEFKLSSCAAITGTNFKIGDQFLFTLERIAAVGDAYAGDTLVATVGLHYECDTMGSRQILAK